MLFALILACSPPPVADAVVSDVIPTVVHLNWESTLEGNAFVRFGETSLDFGTPLSSHTGTSHKVAVYGLKAGQDVVLQGVVWDEEGNEETTDLVELSLDAPPEDMPRFEVTQDSDDLLPGYVLLSILEPGQGWVMILDQDADPVWYTRVASGLLAMSPKTSLDGQSILYDHYDVENRTDVSGFTRVSMNGVEQVETRLTAGHHDFAEFPDGEVAWIAADMRDTEVDGKEYYVAGDEVRVRTSGTQDDAGRSIFSFWDSTEPIVTCDHFYDEANYTGAKDWTHANSLIYLPQDESMVVLAKNLDAMVKFEVPSGKFVWQIGGGGQTMSFLGEGFAWSHPHISHVWEDGFVIFDNAYHTNAVSQAAEFRFDVEAGTYERVWSYEHPDKAFVQLLGDVRKLPDATYLMSWTSLGTLSRVDGDGNLLWQAESQLGAATGRVTFIEDLYTLDR
ncbi:aryl-sulfate sulfotransferase [Myxococcota bacterium]|nr:aryl-sulfate sulfotransferase [Myxococcota bacterium]